MRMILRAVRFGCSTFRQRTTDSSDQSKHYIPKISVQEFLKRNNITFKPTQTGFQVRECPFCTKPHHNELTNLYTLNVHRENGMFFCFRCSAKGSWVDFRGKMLGASGSVYPMLSSETNQQEHQSQQQSFTQVEYFLFYQNMKTEAYKDVLGYLVNERGLNQETIERYKLGAGVEKFEDEVRESISVKVIYFPMFRMYSEKERKQQEKELHDYIAIRYGDAPEQDQIAGFQKNRVNSSTACLSKTKIRGIENKKHMRVFPTGSRPGLFGLNLVTPATKQVVITEGEYDAMSVYQETGIPALSLPQGANSLPDNVLPYLDNFEKIYLWMDNDEAGLMNVPKIASKLGVKRCFIVENSNLKMKDANDVLRQDRTLIKPLLQKARTIPGQSILNFDNLKEKVRNRILHLDQNMGIKSSELKFFNRKVKGLRTGELTIFSGGTGSGKTTLLSQMSLDFCKKGVPTLWGSFEIQNEILVSAMMNQFSDTNLTKHPEKLEHNFAKFAELPLYYMSFFGSTDLEKVFSTIEYAIEKYQISHIIIDTLQFLLADQATGFQKFDLQDRVMGRLRRIATQNETHVTVVIHPRKTDDGEDLGLHSIFGSSKSVQEADNVWIIQQRQGFKILDVKKNRFDGELGKVALGFNKATKKFFELTQQELTQLFKKSSTIDELVQRRFSRHQAERERELEEAILGKTQDESNDMFERQRKKFSGGPYQK